ncbi:MAG TPA: hypothetical protein VFS41_00455 [Edaphobacter sp.]|nr:hypothetical protein [Edaphobacter sp.]
MPSQKYREDSYGNQEGKQQVHKEILEQEEHKQERNDQKEKREQNGIEADSFKEVDQVHSVDVAQKSRKEIEQEIQHKKVQPVCR